MNEPAASLDPAPRTVVPGGPAVAVAAGFASVDQWSMLAGLRFVLASIVAVAHLKYFVSLGWAGFLPGFGPFESIMGFLLISGYSVTVSYLKEPGRFLIRRLQRLYPIYAVSIVLSLVVGYLAYGSRPSVRYLLLNAAFLNQLFTDSSLVGPAWSLSLEFWLYCLAPWLIGLRPKWNRALVYLSFGAYLIYTACRTLFHLPYYSSVGYGGNLLYLSFAWICGLRLAYAREAPRKVMWDVKVIFTLHLLAEAGIQFASHVKRHTMGEFFRQDLPESLMHVATLGLVYVVFTRNVLAGGTGRNRSRILRVLGDVSYPLYLVHLPIYILLSWTPVKLPILYYLVAVLTALAIYSSVDFYSRRRHLRMGTG